MSRSVTLFALFLIVCLGIIAWFVKTNNRTPTSPTKPTCSAISIVSPQAGNKVSYPLSISVIVDNSKSCHWTVFEAQAGIAELTDSTGTFIGRTTLTTTDDWMLAKPIPYNGLISFSKTPAKGNLTLSIIEENPSGKPNPQIITVTLSQ